MDTNSLLSTTGEIKGLSLKRKMQSSDVDMKFQKKINKGAVSNQPSSSKKKKISDVPIGQFGLRKVIGKKLLQNKGSIRLFPTDHLSNKNEDLRLQVNGSSEIIQSWYTQLPNRVIEKFERTGFKLLFDGLSDSKPDTALIHCLAEKWWDTTHTFHFENMGEMTMTPTDFSAISGLRVGGKLVCFDKYIHKNKQALLKYLGAPITTISGKSIQIKTIREAYNGIVCDTSETEDMLLRAFIIALLGTTIFANSNRSVHLYYLPMLMDVDNIEQYNWGGAGLAYLYEQMDDISRCNTDEITGLWKAWEIWAREYIPSTRIIQPSTHSTNFPFSLRWKHTEDPSMEIGVLMQYYRIKFLDLLQSEVNWKPWGEVSQWPETVKQSETLTQKRIMMLGPRGAEWYLGERVTIQSIATSTFFMPKPPPQSMLLIDMSTVVTEEWALQGKAAIEFVQKTDNASYEEFTKDWSTAHLIEAKIEKAESTQTKQHDADYDLRDDIIPMPPWTLLVPSTVGGPNIICIPKDVGIENLNIPSHVKHISIVTARKLLSMIGGMQHVLIEQLTSAREIVRDYSVIIQKLKHELDVRDSEPNNQQNILQSNGNDWPHSNHQYEDFNHDTASTNIERALSHNQQ